MRERPSIVPGRTWIQASGGALAVIFTLTSGEAVLAVQDSSSVTLAGAVSRDQIDFRPPRSTVLALTALPNSKTWPVPAGALTGTMAVLAIAYLVGQSVFGPRSPVGVALGMAGFLPMSALTTWAFLRAGRVADDRTARRGFNGYALSFALTAAGTLLTTLGHLTRGTPTLVPWAAALELASYPAAIVGVLSFRAGRSEPIARWRLVIDSTIAVIAALAVAWIYIVAPQSGGQGDPFSEIILYGYPIGDLCCLPRWYRSCWPRGRPTRPG